MLNLSLMYDFQWCTDRLYEHCTLFNHVLIGIIVVKGMIPCFKGPPEKKEDCIKND